LIAILDAVKEGFLRSETSLIQTIGRAARNAEGHVVMYADTMTDSMRRAITETNRRRNIQEEYNEVHGITPKTIIKKVHEIIKATEAVESKKHTSLEKAPESMSRDELLKAIATLEKKMRQAAAELRFEEAAKLRDEIIELKQLSLM
jgi:excinuclease ABC subunit B